jgi:cytochrome P450
MPAASASHPPGPRSRYPGELLSRLSGRDRLAFLEGLPTRYGDVCSFRAGGRRIVLLSHPDDIRDVLVTHQRRFMKGRALQRAKRLIGDGLLTSEGELHLRQRRLVQPAFHRARIAGYADAMAQAAVAMRDTWRPGPVDINAEMMALTMTIVARTLFATDVAHETERVAQALHDAFSSFNLGFSPLASLLDRLPTAKTRAFNRARATLDGIVYRMIAERRRDGGDRGDLLSMLLAAQDTEGDGTGMSDTQLRDELLTLFLAGHETTANALSWTWMLLAQHPAVRDALHAEVDAVLGDRTPAADDMSRLPYARAVLAEAMRLYPPAYIVGRMAFEPHTVREWTFPKGTIFLMAQWITHRDPRWWREPERFLPERWLEPDERPRFAYWPFGGGTRICVGEQFAWMEGVLVLAALVRRWDVHVAAPYPTPEPIITLRPTGGMAATLVSRAQ